MSWEICLVGCWFASDCLSCPDSVQTVDAVPQLAWLLLLLLLPEQKEVSGNVWPS